MYLHGTSKIHKQGDVENRRLFVIELTKQYGHQKRWRYLNVIIKNTEKKLYTSTNTH